VIPALWLCGPSGVGKTTVAWQIYSELRRSGVRVGFVDIDQLGICSPEQPDDAGRHRMKAQNLNCVIGNFATAGAQCVVVSGVVDPAAGVHHQLLPAAAVTVCRLRAEHDELKHRYDVRSGRRANPGKLDDVLADTLAEACALDGSDFADVSLDTSGVPPAQVAVLVRGGCRDWPGFNETLGALDARVSPALAGDEISRRRLGTGDDESVVLLCGVTGVGKSTIGFEVHTRTLRSGRAAAYIDLGQIGFLGPAVIGDAARHQVTARNLAALWETFRSAGATHLTVVGRVESAAAADAYRAALPAGAITLCLLTAGRAELTRRIMSRGDGGSWPEPGDPLIGHSAACLRQVASQAAADARALERELSGAVLIDTSGRSVSRSAELVIAATRS